MRLHRALGAAAYVYRYSYAFHSPRNGYNSPSLATLAFCIFVEKRTNTYELCGHYYH